MTPMSPQNIPASAILAVVVMGDVPNRFPMHSSLPTDIGSAKGKVEKKRDVFADFAVIQDF